MVSLPAAWCAKLRLEDGAQQVAPGRRRLKVDGIHLSVSTQGRVETDMKGVEGRHPAESAAGIVQVVDGLDADNTGSFWKWKERRTTGEVERC